MKTTQEKIKLVSGLLTATGIFCIMMALLLLINYWHIRQNKPLESEAMKSLIAQFQADPDNEALKNEIRSLDLLARKAFFTSNWQINTGAMLLLIAGIAFATLLRIYHSLKARILEPLITGLDPGITRILSQRWILLTGSILLVSALTASFLTTDYLKFYEQTGDVVQVASKSTIPVAAVDVDNQPVGNTSEQETPAPESTGNTGTNTADSSMSSLPPSATGIPATNVATENHSENLTVPATGAAQQAATPAGAAAYYKNHPSFRGPFGLGLSKHTGIPVDWDGPSGRNVKWKVELKKKGYNSPVIWGNKLFIAGGDNESRVVYCFNRTDGKLLWEHEARDIPGSPAVAPKTTSDTGLSAPSVCTDGQHVYAIFATGDLVALDLDGKRIWAKNMTVPDNHYGHSSSLLVWKDKLIVQYDTNRASFLMALNTQTGEFSWNTPRKTKISWSSPILAEIDGRYQVVTTSSPTVAGYDFETGAQLWSVDCLSGEVGPSAAYGSGLIFAANEYATLAAIKPGPQPSIVWQADEYLPEAASPAVSDGLLFIATSYGVFVCYDAVNGKKLWEKEYGQGFYGSPMIVEGKVYIMERNGVMHIFKVDRTMTILGEPVLGEKSVVTPAFADGAVYLRGERFLYCIGNP